MYRRAVPQIACRAQQRYNLSIIHTWWQWSYYTKWLLPARYWELKPSHHSIHSLCFVKSWSVVMHWTHFLIFVGWLDRSYRSFQFTLRPRVGVLRELPLSELFISTRSICKSFHRIPLQCLWILYADYDGKSRLIPTIWSRGTDILMHHWLFDPKTNGFRLSDSVTLNQAHFQRLFNYYSKVISYNVL